MSTDAVPPTSAPLTTSASATGPGAGSDGPLAGRWERWERPVQAACLAIVLAPVVVTTLALLGRDWFGGLDWGLQVLRVQDVGTRHSPLVGLTSRWGFSHPGPLSYYLLAPFGRVGGQPGVLIGTGVLNAVALVGTLVAVRRRAGTVGVVVATLGLALLLQTMGPPLLIDPWNPFLPFLPFCWFLALCWGIACDDRRLIPLAVAVGSYAAQSHLSYAPLVGGILLGSLLIGWFPRREWRSRLTWLAIGAGVGLVLWLPPLIQQLADDKGNLGEIILYAREPLQEPRPWDEVAGRIGRLLGPPPAWLVGDRLAPFGDVSPTRFWPAVVTMGVLVLVTALAWWRRRDLTARLGAVAVVATALAVYSSSRVTGPMWPYVMRFWWAIGLLLALAVVAQVTALVGEVWRPSTLRRRASLGLLALAVVGAAIASGVTVSRAVPAPVPAEPTSTMIGALVEQIEPHLEQDQLVFMQWHEPQTFGMVGVGTAVALELDGYEPRVAVPYGFGFGEWRTIGDPGQADVMLSIISDWAVLGGDAPELPPDARRVARVQSLTADQRARAAELEASIRADVAPVDLGPLLWIPTTTTATYDTLIRQGADEDEVEELQDLNEHGSAYTAYLSSPPERSR